MVHQNVLIIDDHHLIVEGYKTMLNYANINSKFRIANTCEQVYDILKNQKTDKFDLVFLDWSLPPFDRENINDGGDLIPYIKSHSKDCKLIVLTSHIDAFTLYNIVRRFNPEGLICKVDFLIEDFNSLFLSIKQRDKFYSKTVLEQIRQITLKRQYLDNYDRQIIVLLSKGIKTKNLPQYLPLSISSIDKRKAKLRDYFLIQKGSDYDIISAARQQGLI